MAAVVGARSSYQRNHPGIQTESMIIYATTQTHSLAAKAGLVFGIKVRKIEVNLEHQLSLRGNVLRKKLDKDLRNGLHPFILGNLIQLAVCFDQCDSLLLYLILVATLGTTSSGASDNLSEIRKVGKSKSDQYYKLRPLKSRTAKDYPGLWIHLDAAWAGVALSCPELRKDLYLGDINAIVDSLCINFHKVSSTPYYSRMFQ